MALSSLRDLARLRLVLIMTVHTLYAYVYVRMHVYMCVFGYEWIQIPTSANLYFSTLYVLRVDADFVACTRC